MGTMSRFTFYMKSFPSFAASGPQLARMQRDAELGSTGVLEQLCGQKE